MPPQVPLTPEERRRRRRADRQSRGGAEADVEEGDTNVTRLGDDDDDEDLESEGLGDELVAPDGEDEFDEDDALGRSIFLSYYVVESCLSRVTCFSCIYFHRLDGFIAICILSITFNVLVIANFGLGFLLIQRSISSPTQHPITQSRSSTFVPARD